jgi:ubiquinone/menaquinone biosynthesis C-methylase UbiE
MSCGLPFVGFPSGFCRDLKDIHPYSTCIAEDEKSFAELLKKLSCDKWLRIEIGSQCRRFAEGHDWEIVANEIYDALKKAIISDVETNVKLWPPTKKKLELSLKNAKHMILDAGCGTGWLSYEHSRNLKNVVAIDAAKDRVEISKTHRAFEVCRADVASLPFRSDVFDSVICYDVLEHIPDYLKALRDFRKVLKSKGLLVIAVPNRKGSYTLIHDRLMHFRKRTLGCDPRFDHIQLLDYKTFLSSLASEGFKVCNTTNIEFLAPLLYNFRRLRIAKELSEIDTDLAQILPSDIVSEWVIVCQK